MQRGFYFDQTRCTGCYTCVIACKDWHETEIGGEPEDWIQIVSITKGAFPDLFRAYLAMPCLHCENPACVNACPVGAISKRDEDGIVVVDRDVCLGNKDCNAYCKSACPYDVPAFGPKKGAKMQKCDLCLKRFEEGKDPVCVNACPMFALDSGTLNELRVKYGDIRETEGFTYEKSIAPSITFKSKAQGQVASMK
ncbi:MAG: 4Fe-4S dicluster domain-containing protein [Desulfobacterales bacterium]